MSVSRFRRIPTPSTGESYSQQSKQTIAATGTSNAQAQNLTTKISLQGAERVLLFIEVTAKSHGGGSAATKISVMCRVSHKEDPPNAATDADWAFVRADSLTSSTGVSATKPLIVEIDSVNTDFDAGVKLYVLSFPAWGSYASARIWTDHACAIKTSWMRK